MGSQERQTGKFANKLSILTGVSPFANNIGFPRPRFPIPGCRSRGERTQAAVKRNRLVLEGVSFRDVNLFSACTNRKSIPRLGRVVDKFSGEMVRMIAPAPGLMAVASRNKNQPRSSAFALPIRSKCIDCS